MKIAIVTPHPTPLALGGAENLWWGLQDHFNSKTDHRADIVSVMAPEGNFWDLVSSYETFSKLDLSAYDCVISGKYPAWMVAHPYHVCYMLHRLRGLYDTYSGAGTDALLAQPKLRNLAEWMTEAGHDPDPEQIPELFDRLRALRDADLPDTAFAFPGPFSRAVIHFLDNAALSPRRIKRYAAISATVARRKAYFPDNVAVDVLYPPPHRDNYRCGESRYFFTSSRLDGPKRIGLIVEAMRHVPQDIPLLIAGTGPEEARLKALAGDDRRIHFLGYVADDAMPGLYADALAVPFVPADEDYGLITIEAMKSGKPVLTVPDSGGPCEFVRDGETGLVCGLSPAAIGAGLSRLADDVAATEAMGRKALDSMAAITWDPVAEGLLQPPSSLPSARKTVRPKLTVATTFRVYPPMNGGQARVFHLYRNLARTFDIDIVSLGSTTSGRSEVEIAPGVLEITVPMTDVHAEAEYHISKQVGNRPVSDVAANVLLGLTPAYEEALELSALTSMAVIASQPYMIDILRRAAPGKPFWYECQNVELTLKADVFGSLPEAAPLLEEVRKAERDCWINAERVFACTRRDLAELARVYGPTRARQYEVANGVSLENTPFTGLADRRRLQKTAGLGARQLAIFIGSWHGPNLEAVEDILELAPQRPQTRFVVMGSVCLPFKDRALPANVDLLGAVDMETRDLMLSIADVALNPMRLGSGTNLKMLDYMAAGIPVLSTGFGARGLEIEPERHFVLAEKPDFAAALERMAGMSEAALETMILAARAAVEATYSWQVIADAFLAELQADTQDGRFLVRA